MKPEAPSQFFAVHAFPIPEGSGSGTPAWIHLIPAGSFSGRDGRGPYLLDAEAVIAAFAANGMPIAIDYEHQTQNAEDNGQPAPAAGWIHEIKARDDGIWGRVEWTERAREYIAAKEYRYLSPVFCVAPDTGSADSGRVVSLFGAGLTNTPNLFLTALNRKNNPHARAYGASLPPEGGTPSPPAPPPLVGEGRQILPLPRSGGEVGRGGAPALETALRAGGAHQSTLSQTGDTAMPEELLERLRYLFNLPTLASVPEIIAELEKLRALLVSPDTALMRQGLKVAENSPLPELLAAACSFDFNAKLETPDLSGFVPKAEHEALLAERDALLEKQKAKEDEAAETRVLALVDEAIKANKIIPADRESSLALCRKDPEAFAKHVAALALHTLGSSQQNGQSVRNPEIHPLLADAARRLAK